MCKTEKYSRVVSDPPLLEIVIKYNSSFKNCRYLLNKNNNKIKIAKTKLKSIQEKPENYKKLLEKNYRLFINCYEYAYVLIVFSHIYLEAFIYDYAASSKSDIYVKKYLDKLNFISKWVVYPKIISGKEINKSSEAFKLLIEINKTRNNIVHSKSKNIPVDENATFKKLEEKNDYLFEVASQSTKTIQLILTELKKIDPKHPKFTFFDIEKLEKYNCQVDSTLKWSPPVHHIKRRKSG